ncbi:MAG: glycosyltransferase [Bacteroidales bacterium]|nr:glycosyltransferase [Bacteroidales bacterium]
MKELLMTKLRIPSTNVEVLPFFCLSEQINPLISTKSPNSFIFPSTGLSHKNHFVLLKTWELLHQEGHNFELHLTIPETDYKLIKLISNLKAKGLKILNHGIITQRELLTLYRSSEYLVYPSLNESFGLPLIEAIQQNCKVIAADLPYSKETIIPTAKFNPYQPSSLKNAILKVTSQKDSEKKSVIIIENKIEYFIELIFKPVNP